MGRYFSLRIDFFFFLVPGQNIAFIGYTYKSFDAVKARFGDFDTFFDIDELTCDVAKKKERKKGRRTLDDKK